MLKIKTLGQFDVLLDDTSLLYGTDFKRGLLLAYLLEKRKPQSRLEVARLLWPSAEESAALVNLRVLLMRMRREGLDSYLDAGRSTLAVVNHESIDFDVATLRALTSHLDQATMQDLAQVAEIYCGTFLGTVLLDDYLQLNEWASAVRAEMEIRVVEALSMLVIQGISSGYAGMILEYAERLISLSPYNDDSQEMYMLALAKADRVSDALSHFNKYERRLKTELNEQPGQKLIDFVEQLKSRQVHPAAAQALTDLQQAELAPIEPEPTSEPLYFPHIEDVMIGRETETQHLIKILDEGSRLITIVGMGGAGKTFFVRSQYSELQIRFGKAIYYADLRNATTQVEQAQDMLLLSICTALNMTVQQNAPIFNQVVAALQGTKSCLILDNFETVQGTSQSVLELIKTLPQLTVLITSRMRLNFSVESIIQLRGLSQQPPVSAASGVESDAVHYFVHCAQRQDIGYTIDDEKRVWIKNICRKVDALPLAIELAAMQLPFYTVQELDHEISANYSTLMSEVGDLPGDHYSIWAVLDSMWQTLDDEKRRVIAELSVFVGTFHRDAMVAVAPAPQKTYITLINTSLLRTEDPAWFSLHPLVKQYAAQRLTSTDAHQRHAHYFLGMFDGGTRLREGLVVQQVPMPLLATRYHADIVLAWQWAVANAEWELLDRSLLRFSRYFYGTYHIQELLQHMLQLVEALPPVEKRNQQQHRLAGRAAFNIANLGLPTEVPVEIWWERSITWLEAVGDPWDIAATTLAYIQALSQHSGSVERIESLLAQAAHLIETHQLEPLRMMFDLTACIHFLYQGSWKRLQDAQKALLAGMKHPANHTCIIYNLVFASFLNDWEQVFWLADRVEIDNQENLALPVVKQWVTHYLSDAAANKGCFTGAIAQRLAILDGYTNTDVDIMLPITYGELALWQHRTGDAVAAQAAAMAALEHARQNLDIAATNFGQLFVAVFFKLKGDTAAAIPLLRDVLANGQREHHTTMIFSPLYYLAQIHADKLPGHLVERILKIGAVSPAMHFVLRPLARQHLTAQGLVIADEERETLWATDMKAVEALVDEVMKGIERSA